MAIPDHADRHFRQFLAGKISTIEVAPPFAATQALMSSRNKPSLSQDCAYREFGDCGCVPTRGIDDTNLPFTRRHHVADQMSPSGNENWLQLRHPYNHAGGKGREMGEGHLSAIHTPHHLIGCPLIFL